MSRSPSSRSPSSSSVASSYSISSSYRHHHAPFSVPLPTQPEKVLLQDSNHAPKTRGSVGIMIVGLGAKSSLVLRAAAVASSHEKITWRGPQGQERRISDAPQDFYAGCVTQQEEEFTPHVAKASLAAIGGWDIRNVKLGDALLEAQILDYDLVRQLKDDLNKVKVFRGHTNAEDGDHVLDDTSASDVLKCLRADIRYFKWRNGVVGHTTVLWRAAEEKEEDVDFELIVGLEDARDLLNAMEDDVEGLPSSLLYATAALLEGCSFVTASLPCFALQCPGLHDLARQQVGVYCIGGISPFQTLQEQTESAARQYLKSMGYHVEKPYTNTTQLSTTMSTTSYGFLSQPQTLVTMITQQPSGDALSVAPRMLDAAVWCDFFSSNSWPMDRVQKALSYLFADDDEPYYIQLQELKLQVSAVIESKTTAKSCKKKRVRIRPEEKTTEWAIPHDASIVCAGLACVDMQLNQASGGDGGENIETFEGETSIGGGSVSMACKTLARLCHGAPLDEQDFMQVTPPVVHSVVPLCILGYDDTGNKLLSLLEDCGSACRNVDTRMAKRNRNEYTRTALSVLPIYMDGRRGCFFDAASNASFSSDELIEMLHMLSSPTSTGPELDISTLSEEELDEYHDRVEGSIPAYGAFLFGYPHLLPKLQGEDLARVFIEARECMIDGGITALDLNGVPSVTIRSNRDGPFRDVNDLRHDPVIGAVLEHVDILHLNEEELCLLTGCKLHNTPSSKLDDEFTIASAINLFLLCGVGIVAVTRGKKGSFVSCNDEHRFRHSLMLPSSWIDCTAKIRAVELSPDTPINTNGAGDSFTAGLLVAAMLRHTGMTVPVDKDGDEEDSAVESSSVASYSSKASSTSASPSSPRKKLTPYQLYMRENYVMIKQQCNDDRKAIFTKCHEMWEIESDQVKAMYERKAQEEGEGGEDAISMRFVNDLNTIDSAKTKRKKAPAADKNLYMTNRSLNLDSAVQFASLVAAHHVDVSTRNLTHIDVSRLLERSLVLPEGLEEI